MLYFLQLHRKSCGKIKEFYAWEFEFSIVVCYNAPMTDTKKRKTAVGNKKLNSSAYVICEILFDI